LDYLRNSDFVKEIKSIATGCKISYQNQLLLNYIYDLYGGGCTSIVFNNNRRLPVIATNLDFMAGDL
jgi:hypothetical protein